MDMRLKITRPELLAQLEERRQAAGHHDFQDTLELVLTESSAWNALPRDAVPKPAGLADLRIEAPAPKPRAAARPAKSRSHARKR